MLVAESIVWLLTIYAGIGFVFALLFVARGIQRLDSAAKEASIWFRLLIIPGAAAFWPLLAWRWARGIKPPPAERNAHRRAARIQPMPASNQETGQEAGQEAGR